jgi:hypothetical protein
MPNLNTLKYSNPEILSQIRKDLLLAWLWPMRDYFARRGLQLPAPDSDGPLNCDTLAGILMDPAPDMPAELLESLCLFREMDNDSAMDAIRTAAQHQGLDLGPDHEATPLDVVVRAWTLAPRLVEALHSRLDLKRPRSFKCFATDADPLPAFRGATPEQLAALESRLDTYYQAAKRGQGAKVFPSQQGDTFIYVVRHGAPFRREGAMKDGAPTSVFFRPQRHDVLKYGAPHGEMDVNCCSDPERRVLLRLFGACLFGRPDFFPDAAKYTLHPLVRDGRACLACADVPGMEWVRLVGVDRDICDAPKHRDSKQAADVFELVESGGLRWPTNIAQLKRATFLVKFCRAPKPRRFTILPCNHVIYGRPEDSRILQKFMRLRGFIAQEERSLAA